MANIRTSLVSGSAAVDWHDLTASGGVLEGMTGKFVINLGEFSATSRVAAGVSDPGTSASAGQPLDGENAVVVHMASNAANDSVWVQTPASQESVDVIVDTGPNGLIIVAS